ncbi:MAG: ABC transporter ATP-binding protein, partial [Spirochaetota bacterium]
MAALEASACRAGYAVSGAAPPQPVFEHLDLTVETGELVTVVGRSGSGKSTLLLVLSGLKQPSEGRVSVDGSAVGRGDPRIGLVLQHYGLFPWYTVLDNVVLGMRIRRGGTPGPAAYERAQSMLARLGLEGKEDRYPRDLSGGEQQRVALARTLVLEPRVLLLDEPFSALDALTREELQDRLLVLLADARVAAVMVTHSIEEAVYLGTRVGILAD